MPSKKRATPVSLQPLDALFGTNEESINGISEIAIGSLHPFPNHATGRKRNYHGQDGGSIQRYSENYCRCCIILRSQWILEMDMAVL